jgi:myo-inositol-1(or 4)-monophosphatase
MKKYDFRAEEKVIKEAAYGAGKLILEGYNKDISYIYKGNKSLLTKTDKNAEKAVLHIIKKNFREYDIVSEESKPTKNKSDYIWYIDPLDGTTNFAHKYPFFCVSIGLAYRGELILGAVYDPFRKEMFFAKRNYGAYLNNKRIRVSKVKTIDESLLVMGFPYDIKKNPHENVPFFKEFLIKSQAVRRDGAAALDICYVACGRVDGFFERKLFPWDVAAGLLILKEAGGISTDMYGKYSTVNDQSVLATNGLIHKRMLSTLKKVIKNEK